MKKVITIIGREQETRIIDRILLSPQAEFLAVYGRRRVGKTFLVRQYLQEHLVFDITGTKDGNKQQQLKNFFEEYLKRIKTKKQFLPPADWHEAFNLLLSYLESLPKTKWKRVVFIDEMPWLDTSKSGFISALEFFWNQHASKMNNVLLIACGSASSWIKKKLINARGGLHNRVTQRIKLTPFNLYETELFIKAAGISLPRYQILELYMAMGGIPFYLNQIVKGKSATQLIDEICFSKTGLLYGEYAQLYPSLFKNADYHTTIIQALAAHPQGMTRTGIAAKTKLSEGSLSRTLEELMESDFISVYEPYLNKKKESVYKLTDLYSLFYLKFIKQHKATGKGTWKQLVTKNTYTTWSGYAFENICMLHIQQLKKALGISGVHTITNSWVFRGNEALPGAQIDMIIERADNTINLCEAKFTKENFTVTKKYAAELKLKKTIFKQVSRTRKAIFTTLLTTYPAIRNKYYADEIEAEITMDKLFEQE
jgi:AAA+ ATPase superfamily predicted ATPase